MITRYALLRHVHLLMIVSTLFNSFLLQTRLATAAMVVDLRFADGTKTKPATTGNQTIQIWARLTGVTDIRDSVNPEGIRLVRGNIRTNQINGGAFVGGSGFGVTNVARSGTTTANSIFTVGTSTSGGLARSNRSNLTPDTLQDWGSTNNTITATAATIFDPPTITGWNNGNSILSIGSGINANGGLFAFTGNNFTGTRYFPAPGYVPPTVLQIEGDPDDPINFPPNPALAPFFGLTDNVVVGFTNSTGNAHYLDNAGNVLAAVPSGPTPGGVEFHIGNITFNGGALNFAPGSSTQLVWTKPSATASFAFTIDGNPMSPGGYVSDPVLNTITFTSPLNPVLAVSAGNPVTINVIHGGSLNGPSVTLSETAGGEANSITGTVGGGVVGKVQAGAVANIPANGSAQATITLTPTGSATVGTFTGTVAYAADGFTATAGSTANVTLNVGNAAFDPTYSSTTFGPALIANVAAGATVTNLSTNSNTGVATGGGPAALGTVATILQYVNSNGTGPATETLSMAWRTRTAAEANPNNPQALLSDVLRLTGMSSAPGANTGTFVLQMNYDLAYAGLNEDAIAASGELQLAWRNGSGMWVNAIAGNNNGAGSPSNFVLGPAQLNAPLGTWGVDTNSDTVWAVLNHNSDFAVIPEPSTLLMGTLAALGLGFVGYRRRRNKGQSSAE